MAGDTIGTPGWCHGGREVEFLDGATEPGLNLRSWPGASAEQRRRAQSSA
jgi:hypothetical protein